MIWSADTLFGQVSIDHNMDVQFQYKPKAVGLWLPITWNLDTILCNSVVIVVIIVMGMHLQAILLAMATTRNQFTGLLC